jgi:hypothetical protein
MRVVFPVARDKMIALVNSAALGRRKMTLNQPCPTTGRIANRFQIREAKASAPASQRYGRRAITGHKQPDGGLPPNATSVAILPQGRIEVGCAMRRLPFWIAIAIVALTSQVGLARDCNFITAEDRQGIKNSVRNGALNQTPQVISLESLMDNANPQLSRAQKRALDNRRWGGRLIVSKNDGDSVTLRDGDMITVEGFLYHGRCQKDGDWHLEIGTVNRRGSPCLIVESPDPDRIDDGDLKALAKQVREVIDRLPAGIFARQASGPPVRVSITGPLFLDVRHIQANRPGGGRGTGLCATNVWEVHPITDLTVLDRAPVIGPN